MIIWIFPSIISAALLLMGYRWTRHCEQQIASLIPAPVPGRDAKSRPQIDRFERGVGRPSHWAQVQFRDRRSA
jgi:hypothetical protein